MSVDNREVWRNPGNSKVWIKVQDVHNPQVLQSRLIGPGQSVDITVTERVLNERLFADRAYNFFRNGTLEAVQLVETAADFEQLNSDINVKGEAELVELFKLSAPKLKKELAAIESGPLITRILELAKADDSLSVGKLNAVVERHKELVIDPFENERLIVSEKRELGLN